MMVSDQPIILDVRTPEEYEEGHIEGAILIPDNEITAKAEELLSDKNATILVYCRSGRRSALAAQALSELGYNKIYDFGGIIDWPYDVVVGE
jgi:rhodanese-related sulfurtransferase